VDRFLRRTGNAEKERHVHGRKAGGDHRYILKVYENKPNQISIFVTEVSGDSFTMPIRKERTNSTSFFLSARTLCQRDSKWISPEDIQANYLTNLFLGSIDTFLSVLILGNEKITAARQKRFTDGITNVFMHGAVVR